MTRLRFLPLVLLPACAMADLSPAEEEALRAMELDPGDVPPSPTNAYADDPGAAALGRLLFFDERMSADGTVACVSCHEPEHGLSDPRRVSEGVEARPGDRHSMPITAVALQRWFLWDGRADSLWAQPLKAIESEREMDFTRAEVAHFVARHYRAEYEAVFGPLPDLSAVPDRARPDMPEWDGLDPAVQDAVQRLFANVGKAFEAYQRLVLCESRFDRWARGEDGFTPLEQAGAATFVREGCIRCHAGPAFSDGLFHNVGVGAAPGAEPDPGRAGAAQHLEVDVFRGDRRYSDDPVAGAALLASMASEIGTLGAFRTASLRGARQRRFFGHRGHRESLGGFLDAVYDGVHLQPTAVGELDPAVRSVDLGDEGAVRAFLGTLDCEPLPPELLDPEPR